jgi:hypothetical protein
VSYTDSSGTSKAGQATINPDEIILKTSIISGGDDVCKLRMFPSAISLTYRPEVSSPSSELLLNNLGVYAKKASDSIAREVLTLSNLDNTTITYDNTTHLISTATQTSFWTAGSQNEISTTKDVTVNSLKFGEKTRTINKVYENGDVNGLWTTSIITAETFCNKIESITDQLLTFYTKTAVDNLLSSFYNKTYIDYFVSLSNIQRTTISAYTDNKIGCFAQSTKVLNASGRPMCTVVTSITFEIANAGMLIGIITGPNEVITHGPVFVRYLDEIPHEGELMVPGNGGCRPINMVTQLQLFMESGMPRVRVIAKEGSGIPEGFVPCFIT